MKISGTVKMTGAIILSLMIGFLIGISVDYPKIHNQDLSGAIAKVKNFRNVKASEKDIKLKDDLVSDTAQLKTLQAYVNYQYLKALTLTGYIEQTIAESNKVDAFRTTNQDILNRLSNYGTFLARARQDLMLFYVSLSNPKDADPVLLREMLEEAGNTISQIKFQNETVLDAINSLEAFLNNNPKAAFPGLEQSHDVLMLSILNSSVMTDNKLLQKWLSDKQLLTDVEKLSFWDSEALKRVFINDSEKLGLTIPDAEKLGVINDKESLKLKDQLMLNSQEKLGVIYEDQEKLGYYATDAEKLGGLYIPMYDQLKLNSQENLRALYPDSEILGGLIGI